MTKIPFRKPALVGAALFSAMAGLATPAPAMAQEGLVMRNIFGKLGLLPEEKDPIVYHERPALVVPKDTSKLRTPEQPEGHTKNGQWPVDPDIVERERERARRNVPIFAPLKADASEGNRLSLEEMRRGRSVRGATLGESPIPRNDKDGVRLDIHQMEAAGKTASAPSYPPGTEPPRVYLTDPPKGLRVPSANAPVGKRTTDGPVVDTFRKLGAWNKDPE
ncbi:MAG TPA: hypothetical protein PKW21_08200 [Rhabdaerophilum sp.]|nr:hypothetical protein [Rhabdaerophilum sp.]